MDDLKKIGKIKGAHGLKGEVEVYVFSKETSWAKKLKNISLTRDDSGVMDSKIEVGALLTQYEVLSVRLKGEILLLALKSIEDRTAAEKLIGSLVCIPAVLLKSKKGEMIFLSEILGFKVFDGKNHVGEIISFASNGPQDLLVVKGENHQSEIPFVEAFIEKIDFEGRLIRMNLPEGLINLDAEDD